MIRILHVVSSLNKGSGVMNFIMNYYRLIDKTKINFDFIYFYESNNSFESEILNMGGKIFKIKKPSISYSFYNTIKYFFKNHADDYVAIHCHPIFSFFFFAKYAKKYGIKNVIQHTHTTKLSEKKLSAIRNWLILKTATFYVTNYVSCSVDALKVLPKNELKKKGFTIINNAIDLRKYKFNEKQRKKIRRLLNISQHTKVIGHVGRFSKEKNHMLLLEMFKKYSMKNNDSILLLLGEGKLKKKILRRISKLGLSKKVIMPGVKKNVENYLFAMDFFVFPSDFEGLGIAAVEAQVSGLRTICSLAVPNCAIISPLAQKCDTSNVDYVVDLLSQNYECDRAKIFDEIEKSDFDIHIQKSRLEDFYLSLDIK